MSNAEKLQTLEGLYRRIREDLLYRNEKMGSRFVPGRGSLQKGGLVFVGEAPGREEEIQGAPFVGAAGRNLDALFDEFELDRKRVFITNLIKYRPTGGKGGNRSPTVLESRHALPYLLEELRILAPSLVVCLGLSAAKAVLQEPHLKMGNANGAVYQRRGQGILVTYHPSPLNFRMPQKREALREAFKRLKEICCGPG